MNALLQPIVLRLVVYALSSLLGLIPAAYAGLAVYSQATGDLTIHVSGIVAAALAGLAVTGGIFAKWGVK